MEVLFCVSLCCCVQQQLVDAEVCDHITRTMYIHFSASLCCWVQQQLVDEVCDHNKNYVHSLLCFSLLLCITRWQHVTCIVKVYEIHSVWNCDLWKWMMVQYIFVSILRTVVNCTRDSYIQFVFPVERCLVPALVPLPRTAVPPSSPTAGWTCHAIPLPAPHT